MQNSENEYLMTLLNSFVNGIISYETLEKEYYNLFFEIENENISEIHNQICEKMDFVSNIINDEETKDGLISVEDFKLWLKNIIIETDITTKKLK